jgi:hypothetical protein
MHSENFSASAPLPPGMTKTECAPLGAAPALEPELLLVAGGETLLDPDALVVVVFPRWATEALFGLLPQAATSRAPLAIKTLMRPARRLSGARGLGNLFMTSLYRWPSNNGETGLGTEALACLLSRLELRTVGVEVAARSAVETDLDATACTGLRVGEVGNAVRAHAL